MLGSCVKSLEIYRPSFLFPTQVEFNNTSSEHGMMIKAIKDYFLNEQNTI